MTRVVFDTIRVKNPFDEITLLSYRVDPGENISTVTFTLLNDIDEQITITYEVEQNNELIETNSVTIEGGGSSKEEVIIQYDLQPDETLDSRVCVDVTEVSF